MRSPYGVMLHLLSYWMCVDMWEKSPVILSACMVGNALYIIVDVLGVMPEQFS